MQHFKSSEPEHTALNILGNHTKMIYGSIVLHSIIDVHKLTSYAGPLFAILSWFQQCKNEKYYQPCQLMIYPVTNS